MKLNVLEKDLVRFEQDLWKDARKLELDSGEQRKIIRRYSDKRISVGDEYKFITGMIDKVPFQVPEIIDHSDNSISFLYIAGTRAFNLLMDLRALSYLDDNDKYQSLGIKLVDLLGDDLQNFQATFKVNFDSNNQSSVYPAQEKLYNVYEILTSVLQLDVDLIEIEKITDIYSSHASVPFRDATTKNAILNLPNLFKRNFACNRERQNAINKMVLSGELEDKLDKDIIYHIDFSGCCYLCPVFDDWVALREHEAAAWLDLDSVPGLDGLSIPELCAKFVRYSRLGGRKLAYRLLNNQGYQIRFSFDSEGFYFHHLRELCFKLRERGVLESQNLETLMLSLEKATSINPNKDYFHDWKSHHRNHTYYSDVFPD